MIGIVDYGRGNIGAIFNLLKSFNIDVAVVDDTKQLKKMNKIILAGVGSFDDSINCLNNSGLREVLDDQVLNNNIPVLGICIGMQIMACSSEEGKASGLCWIDNSKIIKINEKYLHSKPKLPHMGWNTVRSLRHSFIFDDIDKDKGFYFLHSYHFSCEEQYHLGTTNYGIDFPSAVQKKNIFGVQFHPEKSHSNGIQVLKNFSNFSLC